MAGLLFQATQGGRAQNVPQGSISFLAFGHGGKDSIGTKDLRSCSAVLFASESGAILAHIPPDPSGKDKPVITMMSAFQKIYNQKKEQHFPSGGETWVITALYNSGQGLQPTMPDAKQIIESKLAELGLHSSPATYAFKNIHSASSPQFPGKGTVFVDRKGSKPVIYVEDERMN